MLSTLIPPGTSGHGSTFRFPLEYIILNWISLPQMIVTLYNYSFKLRKVSWCDNLIWEKIQIVEVAWHTCIKIMTTNLMLLPLLILILSSWTSSSDALASLAWNNIEVHTHRRLLSTSGPSFEIINASIKVDEEHLAHYKPSRFYPVHLGNIFESRYQVLSKLGYGSCSTVWLSHDIMFVIFHSHAYLS